MKQSALSEDDTCKSFCLTKNIMDYDDDYEDYSQDEGFDEDKLTNEEYEQLHEVLPKLRKQLATYNDEIPEYDLKEALYANYWDVDASLA